MTIDAKRQQQLDTALISAVRENNIDQAKLLLAAGAQVDAVDTGKTALLWAVIYGHRGMTRALLDAGADMYAVDGCFYTGFHYAIQYDRPDIGDLFVERGFDVNYQRNKDYSNAPIHMALSADEKGDGSFPRIEYLLSRGARTDVCLIRDDISYDVAAYARKLNHTHVTRLEEFLVSYPLKKAQREAALKSASRAKVRFVP